MPRQDSLLAKPQKQKTTAAQTAAEGAKRLGSFGAAMRPVAPNASNPLKRLQDYAKTAGAVKKPVPPTPAATRVEPKKPGFFQSMYDKYSKKK